MQTKKRINVIIIVLLSAGLVLSISGCKNQPKRGEEKPERQLQTEEGWISLFDGKSLAGWEITRFGTEGPVRISEGNIVLGMGDGCSGITWEGNFPTMNYEVTLEAKKVSGNDFFCGMTFPADSSFCSLIVGGWGGPVTGLSCIDGSDASENETRILKKFEHDTWYQIRLKVTPGKIEAWIDGEQIIDFSTTNRELSIRPEVGLSKPFGICSWMTTAALRNIRLKRIEETN